MLISFAATNHRSIRGRVELSLVAERNPPVSERAVLPVPGFDLAVVPVAAIVGANGSGKSNLLSALQFMRDAIAYSQTHWRATDRPPRDPFVAREGSGGEPSTYEVTFVVAGAVYEYEFRVGPRAIEHEQLFVSPSGPRSRTRLFERSTDLDGRRSFTFGRRLAGPRAAAEAATRSNSLFLSSAAQNNHESLTPVWNELAHQCRVASPHDRGSRAVLTAVRLLGGDEDYRRRLRAFITSADLGIDDVNVRLEPWEQERPVADDVAVLDPEAGIAVRTSFEHGGDVGTIELENESAGTQAWFQWAAPVLDALDVGAVLGADELDAHLNEHLAARMIAFYQSAETNRHGAQLIFTTQDPYVITLAGLVRDQVWVAEKLTDGSTTLVPVSDYRPRRDWEVGRAYRHGRFGGLPVIDDDGLAAALGDPERR